MFALNRGLGLVFSFVLSVPLFSATVELARAPQCNGELHFTIAGRDSEAQIIVAAAASSFESAAGTLTLAEPATCWTMPMIVGGGAERLSVPVLKARLVRGSIAPSNDALPKAINVAFRPPQSAVGTLVTDVASVDRDRKFVLRLPAEPLDLRIGADHFAPEYLWRFDGDTIAPLKLIPGASISGWVTTPEKKNLSEVTVRLVPASASSLTPPDESQRLQTRRVNPNRDGFFQIAGIASGTWSLEAEAKDLSPSRPLEIELREGSEEALREPLQLRPNGSLSITISPIVNVDGDPWQVELQRRIPLSSYTKLIATEAASVAGHWMKEPLESGEYIVRIRNKNGDTVKQQEIEVTSDAVHVDVRIEAVAIRGEVRMGDKPIAVSLQWQTMKGERTSFDSNEEGIFSGVLPKPGTWYVDVRNGTSAYLSRKEIEVDPSDDGKVDGITIDIPSGTLRGKVVDRGGRPVKAIAIMQLGMAMVRDAIASEDGTFEFVGLEEGAYVVRAESEGYMSNAVPVAISESTVAEVTVVVDPVRRVQGWLTTPESTPLAGAQIWYWNADLPLAPAQSGPAGQFTLKVSAQSSSIELAVVTPSRPAKLIAVPLPPKGERLHVTVGSDRSTVRLKIAGMPPYPYVFSRGAKTSLPSLLRMPGGGMSPEWLDVDTGNILLALEPATYDFCESPQRVRCVTVQAVAGSAPTADLNQLWSGNDKTTN